jgi:hypothetical protein
LDLQTVDLLYGVKQVFGHFERLAHFFEKVTGCLYCNIGAEVSVALVHLAADPGRNFVQELFTLVPFISKDHHAVVVFAT